MEYSIKENNKGIAFLVVEGHDHDQEIDEILDMLRDGRAVWVIENDKATIIPIPDNIILGEN